MVDHLLKEHDLPPDQTAVERAYQHQVARLRADLAQRTAELEQLRSQVDNCQANAHYRAWQESQAELAQSEKMLAEFIAAWKSADAELAQRTGELGQTAIALERTLGWFNRAIVERDEARAELEQARAVVVAARAEMARLGDQGSDLAHALAALDATHAVGESQERL